MYRLIYCPALKPRTVKSIGGVSVKLVNSYVACQVSPGLTGQFKSRFLGLCVTLHEEELGGKGGTWRCQQDHGWIVSESHVRVHTQGHCQVRLPAHSFICIMHSLHGVHGLIMALRELVVMLQTHFYFRRGIK